MSKPLPEKGTAEYYEAVADEPSDFIDDGPEESKTAKAAVKAAAAKVVVQAAAGAGADNEEESDLVKKLRAELAAANAKSAKKTRAPKGLYKTQCDDAIKKIKPTIKYIKDNHNVHLECYMLGLFLKDITVDLPESDDHDAFKRWLTDNKQYFGLKKQTRKSGVGSTNVSVALGDLTIDQGSTDEDEEAGAGAD
jgi:hypothetical protein